MASFAVDREQEFRAIMEQQAEMAESSLRQTAAEWQAELDRSEKTGNPDLSKQYAYAWTLTRCSGRTERRLGMKLLRDLADKRDFELAEEAAYTLAECHFYDRDFGEARKRVEAVLRVRTDHRKANILHDLIVQTQEKRNEVRQARVPCPGSVAPYV